VNDTNVTHLFEVIINQQHQESTGEVSAESPQPQYEDSTISLTNPMDAFKFDL
jgi:hypothetical protein